jgi:hypothetical protein
MKEEFAWEVVMKVPNHNPKRYGPVADRPNRFSIHTLAAVTGEDPHLIVDQMEKSGNVVGYLCPDVGYVPIFYLVELRGLMTDTPDGKNPFTEARKSLKQYPYPQVKGFKRESMDEKYGMNVPFEPSDYPYAKAIKKALAEWRSEG